MIGSAGARAYPPASRACWMMAVFFAAAVLSYSDRLVLGLLVDPMRAELRITDTDVGLLQGLAFAVVYSVAGLPFGRLADRFPRRLVIVAGVCVWSLATAACGLATSFPMLFAARIGVGLGEAAFAPAAVSMIADSFPPSRRGLAIGVLLTGMSIGSAGAVIIGGGLLQAFSAHSHSQALWGLAPWRQVLMSLAIAGGPIVLLLLTLREPARQNPDHTAPSDAALPAFLRLWPLLVPLYLAVALASAGDFSIQTWTPVFLSRRFGYSPGEVAAALGPVALVAGAVGTIGGGLLSDRLSASRGERGRLTVAVGAAAIGLAASAIGLSASGGQALAFFAVWLLMSNVSETIGITVLQDTVPNAFRGVGTALVSFCNMILGLGFGAAAPGVLTDHVFHDPHAVGLSITSVVAPSAVLSLVLFLRAFAVAPRVSRPASSPPS